MPRKADASDLATCKNALSLDAERNDISFLGARSQVLLVGRYNELAETTRNKSTVLYGLVAKYMSNLVRAYASEGLVIYADKLGGRSHYRSGLQQAFSGWDILDKSETTHLPVALASIYAKYVRELFMELINGYWCGQIEGLRPTAGYYTDGKRFLAEIAEHCKKLNTPMHRLVRVR